MSPLQTTSIHLPGHIVLPLEFHDHVPFLQGTLDGAPCTMMVDSGAPDITLNADRIPAEKLTKAGELMGATGPLSSFRTSFSELRFGDWSMGPMQVLAMRQVHLEEVMGITFQGLIGFRQLVHYDWMIDYPAASFHLWTNFEQDKHPVRFSRRVRYLNHLPLLRVVVGGEEFHWLLDTGCSGIVFDQKKQSRIADWVDFGPSDKLQGANDEVLSVEGGRLRSFSVGEIEVQDQQVKFSDLGPLQDRLGPFDGIIGYPLLGQVRVVVSWENKRLFFLED